MKTALKIQFILFILAMVTVLPVLGQTGVTLKFKREKPVEILIYERLYDPNAVATSKKQTLKQNSFTKEEVEEIFNRLAKPELLPQGLSTNNSSLLSNYHAFEIANFKFFGYSFSLVWLPYQDNLHMPNHMQPPTKDGSIYYTYTKNLSFNPKRENGQTAQVQINTSKADMSAFLGGGKQSSGKAPTNSSFNKADAALVGQAITDYNKMDERLRTLDNLYSIEFEKIKKQIEKDQQTKVKANLFMNKERANANAYLKESRQLLTDYLKKYDAAIGPDFKATLEGWLKNLPYYIPI